jgi:hypothetical protein
MVALIVTGAMVLCLSPVTYLLFRVHVWPHLRHYRGSRRYRKDMKHVKAKRSCARCGGSNTRLRKGGSMYGKDERICKDRELCETTRIYTVMIESL